MRLFAVTGGAVVCLCVPRQAHSQAVVGEPSSLSAGVSYTLGMSSKIVETDGIEIDNVDVTHHVINLSADYVLIDRLAIEAELPIVGTKWDDTSFPHFPTLGEWDDGDLHFAATNLRAGLRFQLLREPLQAAISLAGSIPVSDYPTYGYTAPDRGLKAAHAGISLLRTLDPVAPRLYLFGSYEFSLVEKYDEVPETEEFGQNHSDIRFQVGYFVLDQLELHGSFDARLIHGGIDFVDFLDYSEAVQENHDGVLREQAFLVGGGLGYQVTDSLTLGADFRLFVGGANVRNANLFGVAAQYQIF